MSTDDWARPMFQVSDLSESLNYYCEKLGFSTSWVFGGPHHSSEPPRGSAAAEKPVIAGIARNGVELILDDSSAQPKAAIPSVIGVELHDYEGLGALYEVFLAAGAKIRAAPFQVDWAEETMQMEVEDLDGNVLVFWGNTKGSRAADADNQAGPQAT